MLCHFSHSGSGLVSLVPKLHGSLACLINPSCFPSLKTQSMGCKSRQRTFSITFSPPMHLCHVHTPPVVPFSPVRLLESPRPKSQTNHRKVEWTCNYFPLQFLANWQGLCVCLCWDWGWESRMFQALRSWNRADQALPGKEIALVLNTEVKYLEKGKSCMRDSGV